MEKRTDSIKRTESSDLEKYAERRFGSVELF